MKRFKQLLLTLCVISPLLAWPAVSYPQTQSEMNDQAYYEYQKADAKLNEVYKTLMAKMDDAEAKKKLVAAEKAWITFRDAESETEADDYRGGSIWPMIYNGARKELTLARTKQLQQRIDDLNHR